MTGQHISISSSSGGQFDCYLATSTTGAGAGVVIMPSIFGVDKDVENDIDMLAAKGYFAASPDPFWRGDNGPKPRTEAGMQQARARAQNRSDLMEWGVQDLADVIRQFEQHDGFNGKVAVIGLCYGGPFAILGPARLGCAAGISFHGTKVEDFIDELDDVHVPLTLHWGDDDHAAPMPVIDQFKTQADSRDNVNLSIYPGVQHGYTARSSTAWHDDAATHSWNSAFAILSTLA